MASVVLTTAQYFGGYNQHFGGFGFNSLTDNFGGNNQGFGGLGGLGGGIGGGQPSVRDPRQNRGNYLCHNKSELLNHTRFIERVFSCLISITRLFSNRFWPHRSIRLKFN